MARIAYILLCHKDPVAIIKQAERLTASGDYMSIHFDASASPTDFAQITQALGKNPNVTFASKRIRCGWGEWSLVQATLNAVESAIDAFPRATHFYMLSGDCMAIKSAEYIHDYLDDNDVDFIESFDYFESDWIKTGWKEERLIYRHWFNERTQKKRFYGMFELQKRLGLTRDIPADLQIQIGSQWWCLRRQTIEAVMAFTRKRKDVMRFFRTTWIPDETFFQTIVRHIVPDNEIRARTLTFLMFTDYGMPVTFYNDHYDLLLAQDYLFARKISSEATDLKRRLGLLYSAKDVELQISNEGRNLFKFLTGRGRIGRGIHLRLAIDARAGDGFAFGLRFASSQSQEGEGGELTNYRIYGMSQAYAFVQALAAAGAKPEARDWSFHGMFGTYDRGALQRGFQIYLEVCAACHSMSLVAYRNLAGIGLSEDQIDDVVAYLVTLGETPTLDIIAATEVE